MPRYEAPRRSIVGVAVFPLCMCCDVKGLMTMTAVTETTEKKKKWFSPLHCPLNPFFFFLSEHEISENLKISEISLWLRNLWKGGGGSKPEAPALVHL